MRKRRKVDPRERIRSKERRINRFEQDARVATRTQRATRDKHKLIVQGGDDWIPKKVLATLTDAPDGLQFRDG